MLERLLKIMFGEGFFKERDNVFLEVKIGIKFCVLSMFFNWVK